MFSKKRSEGTDPGRRKGADLMNQMGFGGVPGMSDMKTMAYGDDDDDDDLEAELAELAGDEYKPNKPKGKRKAPMPMGDIEKLAAIGVQDADSDLSDTEDPSLLAELEDLNEDEGDPPAAKENPLPSTSETTQSPPPAKSSPAPSVFEPTTTSSTFAPSVHASAGMRQPPAPAAPPTTAPWQTPSLAAVSPSPSPRPSIAGGMMGLLEDRLNLYKQAIANAKASGDSSKQRRLDRGMKTLVGLLRQAKAGKPINEEEIPPAVAMGASIARAPAADSESTSMTPSVLQSHQPVPQQGSPQPQTSVRETVAKVPNSENQKDVLIQRRDQYKQSALMAKHVGDMATAGSYVKIAKQFDSVIQAMDQGQPVDLSKMPPAPPEFIGNTSSVSQQKPQLPSPVERAAHQAAGASKEEPDNPFPEASQEEKKSLFNAPDAPKTVMEALTQRLAKYKSSEADAKTAGEGSKARRMGRLVKQYEDVIKCYKAGKPVDFEGLPILPGFAPIPVRNLPAQASHPPAPSDSPSQSVPAKAAAPAPAPRPSPTAAAAPKPAPVKTTPSPSAAAAKPVLQRQSTKKSTSRAEQQLAFLRERMEEFKQAAVSAKKKHDLELAKKYVRIMKGIEPMVEALEAGLPVDLSQVPPSPFSSDDTEDKFVVVSSEDCKPTGDREEVFKSLHEDLLRQIRICVTNAQHYQKLGDVPAAAKFQKLEQGCRKDLDSLKSAHRHGDPPPRFHYEVRTFSMVQSNTDLGDADMEVTIVRGIQYNLPSGYSEKDMDTSVKYELAYPSDEPQAGSTGTVKDTVNPEYKESFKLQISRTSKGFYRFIERKGLKCEIYIKRGFFKGDKLLGTVNVKLQSLERQCTLHESFDLMDGRKSAGGKLEVKIRIRDPFKSKQVDEVKEKWLAIDQFIRTIGSKSEAETKAPKIESGGTSCMEVLRVEKQMLDKQISQLKDSLSVTQTQALRHKSSLIQEKIELQQKKLREGGLDAWKAYLATVRKDVVGFEQEARQMAKLGEVQKAELLITKKKYAEKELAAIKAKIPDA